MKASIVSARHLEPIRSAIAMLADVLDILLDMDVQIINMKFYFLFLFLSNLNLSPMGRFSKLSYVMSIARINRVEIKIFTRYLALITPSPFIKLKYRDHFTFFVHFYPYKKFGSYVVFAPKFMFQLVLVYSNINTLKLWIILFQKIN